MKRALTIIAAGAALAALPASADAALSPARAERAAKQAIAPLQAHSVACFKATFDPRRPRLERHACVVAVAGPANEICVVTVTVTAKKRPRRVSAKVTIPLRCFGTSPPLGSPESR
jgi:hypothetical protein